ncbi:endonuclease/exonuclease/phosphatase family protein [Carboxylicivirga mesophila]|uniref:Endonuclease/exonuclease/phosphatase family protein n=1 Tax=Carboxylicivirga mesophila TaxID=1166478 RepID=A0ABS5KDI3_9BACT|nr:LamG-like jellyroll fold domain-containing protein [Carboxylicivirga mesophila]MBS2212974.1 endonuclease/exonuclease/phosphatase family protein [Carboxylicivirga mesophila]
MIQYCKWIVSGLLLIALMACQDVEPVSKPIIAYHFNNTLKNSGMVKTAIYGPQAASFAYSKKDTSLDLSLNASTRQPLAIKLKDNFSLSDYKGFTVAFWVKKFPSDPQNYTILSHTYQDSTCVQGWKINTPANGAWEWHLSDGWDDWYYQPTAKQTINDGKWHLLAFSYDKELQEARLFYDGNNVAVISLQNNKLSLNSSLIHLGIADSNQHNMDLFNGEIDDLLIWSRVIPDKEIQLLYRQKARQKLQTDNTKEQFKVMTWNIWDGAVHDGRFVGVKRITEIIEQADVDIVVLQKSGQAAPFIADALNYKLYQRSNNLTVLSRFPIINAHNVFQPETVGCIELSLPNEKSLFICPINLNATPNLSAYIQSGVADTDSILQWESATRGKESQFILSELNYQITNANKKPIIIAGDFNSGSHLDWTAKNARHNYGLTIAYPTTLNFEKNGLIDTYRRKHPDETKHFGYTISPRFDSIMKNRTNFIYYKGQQLKPVDSYLIDEHPQTFPSDHAALVTTFTWEE